MYRPLLALFSTLAAPVAAGDFSLAWPIDCTLGETCYIQQYVDRDPGPGVQDFTCNALSYDGHKGTDIALPYLSSMDSGVRVRAAAAGVVAGLRDGMEDRYASRENAADLKGRDCGNAVLLRHAGGWETQYCHLKNGSIRVSLGDRIAAGTTLGDVGLSGQTQFPHLHLSLRQNGEVVDPFNPDPATVCDTGQDRQLWKSPVVYRPAGFIGAGFSPDVPAYQSIKSGAATGSKITAQSPVLVLWAYAYGGQKNDVIALRIEGPEGILLDQELSLEKDQAQFFRAAGKRLRAMEWAAGQYIGEVRLIRDGGEIDRITHTTRF